MRSLCARKASEFRIRDQNLETKPNTIIVYILHRFTTSIDSALIELLRYDVHPIRTRLLKYLYHQDPEQYTGQYRRLLSTTAVRAQAMCLLARVGLVTPAAKEAAGRRELAMRMAEALKRERRAQWMASLAGPGWARRGNCHTMS